eukprot:jgi/Undpi1/427/HiC_scaffold_1.g00423.m1
MSRAFGADASVCIPRMIPWRDWEEWYRVKALLFSHEPYLRYLGVQHVAAWRSRERVPHAVETTSQLVEVRLNDAAPLGGGVAGPSRSEEELRLVYSAVIIRAINGLTGHEQKTGHAIPVSSLAREIGIPTWLVDIRHEAAHKQLPGIVILRLASDFLVDYLWGRYWGPQAEHLGFVRNAFDQLISRYKATSESDASTPCNTASGKKRRTSPTPTPQFAAAAASTTSHAAGGGGRGHANLQAGSSFSSSPRTPSRAGSASARPTEAVVGTGMGEAAKAAAEKAAQAITMSVTPTALSWALVSLLADGGGGMPEGSGGGGEGEGGRKRGQGHLLPRSRDKYPTPGTPGVDEREVSRRLTARWAPLLKIFHARWRGFGATLLVRLVESLLDNASLNEGGEGASGGVGGQRGRGGGAGGRRGKEGSGGGNAGGDKKVGAVVRKAAVDFGLSPTFWEEDEETWTQNEQTWADRPAPLQALQAACFPLRELSGRCRRVISSLTAAQASTSLGHAGLGLHAVCRALDEALAESGNEALAETDTENAHGLPVAGGSSSNTGDDHYGAAKTAARVSSTTSDRRGEQTSAPERKFLPGGAVDAGTSVEAAGVSTMMMDLDSLEMLLDGDRSCGPRDASPPEVSLGVPSVVAAAGGAYATGEGGILQASDRGADVGEEIAGRGGGDFSTAKMSAGVRGGGGGGRRAEDGGVGGLVEEWTGAGEDRGEDQGGDGAGAESFTPTERGASVGVGVGGGEEGGSAWELVEEWTPCPIGTLPGWSSAPLSVVNQTVPSFI